MANFQEKIAPGFKWINGLRAEMMKDFLSNYWLNFIENIEIDGDWLRLSYY